MARERKHCDSVVYQKSTEKRPYGIDSGRLCPYITHMDATHSTEESMTETLTTLEQLAEITGGYVDEIEERVVVGYGPLGYLEVRPRALTANGQAIPGATVEGNLRRRNGGLQAELRAKLAKAGVTV